MFSSFSFRGSIERFPERISHDDFAQTKLTCMRVLSIRFDTPQSPKRQTTVRQRYTTS